MERPLEEFLRLNSTWGLPSPAFRVGFPKPAFTDPAPAMPTAPPMPMPSLYGGAPAAPVEDAAPVESAPPMQGGFTPAPFTLPGKQFERPKNAEVFGPFLERLGIRAPQAALNPAQALMQQQPQEEPAPRYLQAQPQQQGAPEQRPGVGPGEGQASTRRPKQQWQESPALARRYPGATRMRQLVDKAREKRGYV